MVLLNPTSYAVLYIAAIIKGVGNAALSGVMYGMLADTVEYNDWKSGIRAEGLVFSANSIGQKIGSGIGSAVLGWVLAAFGFVSSSAAQPASAISGIRVIFLYVPLVVFAIMFIILLFYKLDKEYGYIVEDLEKRARACLKNHSCNLHAPLCGIFCPNSVAVARYGALIRTKSPTNCDAHLAESLFQTRSKRA